jgi:hypothetical protein
MKPSWFQPLDVLQIIFNRDAHARVGQSLPISMIAIRATRRGKIRRHLPSVELGLAAEPLVLPVGLAEQVVPAAVAVRNSVEQAVQVVVAEHTSPE